MVGMTHNLELPTERMLPSSLSTSTPVLSPVTRSTGLVHALHYGFIIFVLIYSVTLLDIRPEAPVHNWCVSAYLFMGLCSNFTAYTVHFHKLALPDQAGGLYAQLHKSCLLECHMHATHTVHLIQCVCLLVKHFKIKTSVD